MEYIVGGYLLYKLFNVKETFQETYLDSESFAKSNQSNEITDFNRTEAQTRDLNVISGSNNKYQNQENYYVLSDFNKDNSELKQNHNKTPINGIDMKDYYQNYVSKSLNDGHWFLNKDLPQETNQYTDDSQVQQRLEIYTGSRQRNDREMLGIPTKKESLNLFTPQERITGYGYQYGQSGGGGPGLALSRFKEMEELKSTLKFKTNEKPFEQIQVSKGIAMDPGVPAAGGFHEFTRIMPDNIGDYKSNQLPGMVAGGKWTFSNAPTNQVPVNKNRPNRFYTLCQRGPATGKSILTAETLRADYTAVLKNQNRTTVNYGFGQPLTSLDSFLCN
jgi:hypothetical protein